MAKERKEELSGGDLELNEFLSEMVSLLRNKLDEQKTTIAGIEERVNKLENSDIQGMFDSRFREYNGTVGELKERLAGLENYNGAVDEIKRKLTNLESEIKKSKTIKRDLLKDLKV